MFGKILNKAMSLLVNVFAGKLDAAVAKAAAQGRSLNGVAAGVAKRSRQGYSHVRRVYAPFRWMVPRYTLVSLDEFPRGYPGAKLARKAAQGKLARCH
jgi:hypothetical protein